MTLLLVSARGATPQPHGAACRTRAKRRDQFMRTRHQGLANFVTGSSCSNNAATFFWTSMRRRLATATTSESMLGDKGRADTGAILGCMHLCLGLIVVLHTYLFAL